QNFKFEVNENIVYADIDYTAAMDFIERFINHVDNKDMNLYFEVNKEDENITLTLKIIETNEIQFKALENHYKKMIDLKRAILLEYNAMINLNYQSNDHQIILKINIPILKYFGKEDVTNEKG
ncbi:MAG: hypothetical protein MJA31_06900, partial [Clostridia bacterium]|nr:hypothetical protein [Clostridia bacterium]